MMLWVNLVTLMILNNLLKRLMLALRQKIMERRKYQIQQWNQSRQQVMTSTVTLNSYLFCNFVFAISLLVTRARYDLWNSDLWTWTYVYFMVHRRRCSIVKIFNCTKRCGFEFQGKSFREFSSLEVAQPQKFNFRAFFHSILESKLYFESLKRALYY